MKEVIAVGVFTIFVILIITRVDDTYIQNTCDKLKIPYDIAMAILDEENPHRDTKAVYKNENGSWDRGLWQINSYNEKYFMDEFGLPFNNQGPYDYKNQYHSTWWALSYLHLLRYTYRFNWWQVVIAYNCGPGKIIEGKPPDSSIDYAARVFEKLGGRYGGI